MIQELEQQTEEKLRREHLLASLLRDDAVVSRQMHIAVDIDNALELDNRLDDGRDMKPKSLPSALALSGGKLSKLQYSTRRL